MDSSSGSGYRYSRPGYLSNYRTLGGGSSSVSPSYNRSSTTTSDYVLYKGSSSSGGSASRAAPSSGPHFRAFSNNGSTGQSNQEGESYSPNAASSAYQRRYGDRARRSEYLSGRDTQSPVGEGNDGTPSSRYRSGAASRRINREREREREREGVLSPNGVTSPPITTRTAVQRERSPYYPSGDKTPSSSRRDSLKAQTPEPMHESNSVSSGGAADSGYNASSHTTSTGLWSKLEEGMSPPPSASSNAPGTFLFGGKTNVAPPRPSGKYGQDGNFSYIERKTYEPDAEAAMSSMTSIKNELEKKISELEAERNEMAKGGVNKHKQKLLDDRINELDGQLKTLHLSHSALQSAARKTEQVAEHTSQALRMMEHDTTSFEKVKEVMAKEISVLKEALRLSKVRVEKLENDVAVAENGARNVDSLQDKLASAQTEKDKAVMRAERLNSEVKKLTDEVNVLKKSELEITHKMAASKDAFENKRNEVNKTKSELRNLESENSKIKQQNEELLNQLETMETELKHSRGLLNDKEMALQQSDKSIKEMKKKIQDVESSSQLVEDYEEKLSRAEMAIEERETQIKSLKQQLNKKSNYFQNLTTEQEKNRRLERENLKLEEKLKHDALENDQMVKMLEEHISILAKATHVGKLTEPYQAQIDHLTAELSLANDKMQELERIRDKLVQEKVDMVSGASIPFVGELMHYKQANSACEKCGYWKEKHDQLRGINAQLNEQLSQLGSQHNSLKDVVRSVTPFVEKASSETADILGELDSLRRQLGDKESELLEAKRTVNALQDQVQYLRVQLQPDSQGPEDQLGNSGTNMSLNGTTVEDWITNYEVLKQKLKQQKHYFQQLASGRVEESDVSKCGEQSTSLRRLFLEKNFQMDTQLRECEIVHTEIEQMIFNINMKLSKYSTYKDQSHRLQEHAKHLNDEINQLLTVNEKLEADNQSLKEELTRRKTTASHTQALLEKDGQIIDLKKRLNLKEQEIENLHSDQTSWSAEKKSLKVKMEDLQTNLRAKEQTVEDLATKVANQDMQLVQLRHELKDLNSHIQDSVNISVNNSFKQRNSSLSTELTTRSNCWVTCSGCGHVIELSGENLDLTSRVSSLKEMVDKLKRENEELSMQNKNFNDELSSSRNELLQLTKKLNSAKVFQRTLAFYDQFRESNEKLCQKLSRITGQHVPKSSRRFSFSGTPGTCDELINFSINETGSKFDSHSTANDSQFQPLNRVHIKPQPLRSQSLNRLEEYQMLGSENVPEILKEEPVLEKVAEAPKTNAAPPSKDLARRSNQMSSNPSSAEAKRNQTSLDKANAGVPSNVEKQANKPARPITRIPSPVPGRRSPLHKPTPQRPNQTIGHRNPNTMTPADKDDSTSLVSSATSTSQEHSSSPLKGTSVKVRPPSPVSSMVRLRSNQNIRGSNESIDSSLSEATSTGSNVAPKISGRQPVVPRQMTVNVGGSKTASALARRMMTDPTSGKKKAPVASGDPKSLREASSGHETSRATQGPKSEMLPDRNQRRTNIGTAGSLDDLSVNDDTHKDISGASDLPDDHRDNNTSSDSITSDSPNSSISAMQKASGLTKIQKAEPQKGKETQQQAQQQQFTASRVMLGSRPAAKQKDKIAMEQANKLSVRATEDITSQQISTALMRSRTPNSTAPQHRNVTEGKDNETETRSNLSSRQDGRSIVAGKAGENMYVSTNSNPETIAKGARPNTMVYDPNKPDARPSIRNPDLGKSDQDINPASKRAISASPQQRTRQPAIGPQKVLMSKTNVYSPNQTGNPVSMSQSRNRSQSAEAVNPVGTQPTQSTSRRHTESPSISAIQQIRRQYASSEGPLTSSPKPSRSAKTQNMGQQPQHQQQQSSSELPSGSNESSVMTSSELEAKKPWSLDEIDTAIDRLLQEDTARLLTEAEVTNAIDKELEAISHAKMQENFHRQSPSSSTSRRPESNSSENYQMNSSGGSARANQSDSNPAQRSTTPQNSRVARSSSPSIARIKQAQQQLQMNAQQYQAQKSVAPHGQRRPSANAASKGPPEQNSQNRSANPHASGARGRVHYL